MKNTEATKGKNNMDRIVIMLNADGSVGGQLLGWVDGNAIVRKLTTRSELAWYTDGPVVNSKGETVPVEVLR